MDFLSTYNLTGLAVGLVTFVIIGLYHPLVVKAEYYIGVKSWWGFLFASIAFVILSLCFDDILFQTIFGVLGFSSFWSILEVFEQRKRVNKGWFPRNPKKKQK